MVETRSAFATPKSKNMKSKTSTNKKRKSSSYKIPIQKSLHRYKYYEESAKKKSKKSSSNIGSDNLNVTEFEVLSNQNISSNQDITNDTTIINEKCDLNESMIIENCNESTSSNTEPLTILSNAVETVEHLSIIADNNVNSSNESIMECDDVSTSAVEIPINSVSGLFSSNSVKTVLSSTSITTDNVISNELISANTDCDDITIPEVECIEIPTSVECDRNITPSIITDNYNSIESEVIISSIIDQPIQPTSSLLKYSKSILSNCSPISISNLFNYSKSTLNSHILNNTLPEEINSIPSENIISLDEPYHNSSIALAQFIDNFITNNPVTTNNKDNHIDDIVYATPCDDTLEKDEYDEETTSNKLLLHYCDMKIKFERFYYNIIDLFNNILNTISHNKGKIISIAITTVLIFIILFLSMHTISFISNLKIYNNLRFGYKKSTNSISNVEGIHQIATINNKSNNYLNVLSSTIFTFVNNKDYNNLSEDLLKHCIDVSLQIEKQLIDNNNNKEKELINHALFTEGARIFETNMITSHGLWIFLQQGKVSSNLNVLLNDLGSEEMYCFRGMSGSITIDLGKYIQIKQISLPPMIYKKYSNSAPLSVHFTANNTNTTEFDFGIYTNSINENDSYIFNVPKIDIKSLQVIPPVRFVNVKINSNYGNKKRTCLRRIIVAGDKI